MGGTYEKTVVAASKLRIHYNEDEGKVHIHDDAKGIKFVYLVEDWPTAYAKFRDDTIKSNFGILIGEGGVELKGSLVGTKVTLEIRSPIQGLEEFDAFAADLEEEDEADEADEE